jgi:hypothetical protein
VKESAFEQLNSFSLSPTGQYVIYYDSKNRNYFSYNRVSGRTINITGGISTVWTARSLIDYPYSSYLPIGSAGWMDGDSAVFIYDRNDIWSVDPSGKHKASNLTNHYGHKNDIVFQFVPNLEKSYVNTSQRIVFAAFNKHTQENGFFAKLVGDKGDPEKLYMGPYMFHFFGISSFPPIKAKQTAIYIVRRMSSAESPNYFLTRDFRSFQPITDEHPEHNYNWLKSELIKWKTVDGASALGVLYKPDDFDPQKKYPIIFYFYERLSDRIHVYKQPAFSEGPLNIPYFVSNGYLVFTPDIYYKIGSPGKYALRYITSAAENLMRKPWVDAKRMGIQGHSWGGYEVNYLVTHTHLFAAAVAASGPTDFVSGYGALGNGGNSLQYLYEVSQVRIGSPLSVRPQFYIDNSPVFRANFITTPLLLMNNKRDNFGLYLQGVELFTALRRLQKKVWMLQYDDGDHTVYGKSSEDFSMRMVQFFNYYLKDAAAPKWMTAGIPAVLKGIDTGLELDSSGRLP